MSIGHTYNEWSTTYDQDRNLTRDLDQQIMRTTYSRSYVFNQPRYKSILEIGSGTGKNTSLLVQIADRVLGLDISDGMLAQARAKLRGAPVQFVIANLTQHWPCTAESIDLIVCNLVLEHIADLPFIFAQANRVLMPQGRFFICELHPFKQYQGKKATFAGKDGQVEIPAFIHHISDFLNAAQQVGFILKTIGEWWHDEDKPDSENPPRLVSFLFEKA